MRIAHSLLPQISQLRGWRRGAWGEVDVIRGVGATSKSSHYRRRRGPRQLSGTSGGRQWTVDCRIAKISDFRDLFG